MRGLRLRRGSCACFTTLASRRTRYHNAISLDTEVLSPEDCWRAAGVECTMRVMVRDAQALRLATIPCA